MIRVAWTDPRFMCKIVDRNGVVIEEIHCAESKEKLAEALAARIKRGEIASHQPVEDYDFPKWKQRARNATDTALTDYTKPDYKFNSSVWGDLKPYLIQLFGGKCAYCESEFTAVAWGDVEHFRPKGKVTDLDNKEIVVNGKPHPGYYWLAYNPANLMPSCEPCNQARGGKMNRFLIDPKGKRALSPDDPLDQEGALLLSPYEANVDPLEHLKFQSKKSDPVPGLVEALSPRGEASIETYHLNRQELIKRRAKAQDAVLSQFLSAFGEQRSFKAEKQEYKLGRPEYSAAVLTRIERFEDEMGFEIDQ